MVSQSPPSPATALQSPSPPSPPPPSPSLTMTNAHERITLPPISSFDLSPSRNLHTYPPPTPSGSRRPPHINGSSSWDLDPHDDARYEPDVLAPLMFRIAHHPMFPLPTIIPQTIPEHIRRLGLWDYGCCSPARKALPLFGASWPRSLIGAPDPASSTSTQQQRRARPRATGRCRSASILFPVSSHRAAAHVRPLKVHPPVSLRPTTT